MRLLALAALAAPLAAYAYAPPPPRDYGPVFDLAGTAPQTTPARGSAGSTIAATGSGALVLDGDSGSLVAVDDTGARTAALALDAGEGLLVFDRATHRAYVTERRRDRIAIVDVQPGRLLLLAELATPGEPFGIALSPDGQMLYATAIADRVLVAYDLVQRSERWRQPVGAEPRAVAVSPDGKRAIVSHLTTGSVELLDLGAPQTTVRDLRHDVSAATPLGSARVRRARRPARSARRAPTHGGPRRGYTAPCALHAPLIRGSRRQDVDGELANRPHASRARTCSSTVAMSRSLPCSPCGVKLSDDQRPSARNALASPIVCWPKWKIDAASTASAPALEAVREMRELADAARGDHRDRDRGGDRAR